MQPDAAGTDGIPRGPPFPDSTLSLLVVTLSMSSPSRPPSVAPPLVLGVAPAGPPCEPPYISNYLDPEGAFKGSGTA